MKYFLLILLLCSAAIAGDENLDICILYRYRDNPSLAEWIKAKSNWQDESLNPYTLTVDKHGKVVIDKWDSIKLGKKLAESEYLKDEEAALVWKAGQEKEEKAKLEIIDAQTLPILLKALVEVINETAAKGKQMTVIEVENAMKTNITVLIH